MVTELLLMNLDESPVYTYLTMQDIIHSTLAGFAN